MEETRRRQGQGMGVLLHAARMAGENYRDRNG